MIFKTLPARYQSLLKTIFLTVLLGTSVGLFAQAPPYLFANRVGSTDYEIAEDMAIDASGNVYVVGNYASASVTFGSITVTNSTPGNRRFFLAKYDASGTCLWVRTSTTSGTFGSELGYGVTVDGSGNVLATGSFSATNVSFGSVTLTNHNAGYADMFVVKYDASGTAQWAASAGGSRIDQGKGVATDASGNVYVTGTFASQNIEFGLGSGNLSFNAVAVTSPPADIFLAAYDASGVLQWQQTFGGTASDNATSICADASGNMTFTGYFSSTSIVFGSTTLNLTGNSDLFTAQFDGTGAFNWAKDINGSTSGSYTAFYSYDIAADASGNLYIVGDFGTFPVTFGSSSLTNTGFSNFFLAKYNSSGTEQWAKTATIPSGAYAPANKVTTDASGNVIVGGSFLGASIDLGTGSINNTAASFYDMLTAKFNSSGTTLWVKTDGSSNTESVTAVAANAAGQTYVAGTFYSPTLTLGSTTLTNADNTTSSSDIFISKLDVPSSCTAPNGTVAFGAFSGVTTSATTTNVTYTNGSNAATGYVLLRNTTNTAPTAPASGTAVPTAGSTSFVSGYTVVNTTTTIGSSVAFSSTGLSSGTTYYYWVVAYQNTNGPCWFTPAAQANNSQATTTPPACIVPNGTVSFSAFSGVSTSATTTNVTYTNGSNAATGYALLRNTTNTAPTAPASGTAVPAAGSTTFVSGYTVVNTTTTIGSSVAFNSTGLASGTTYYYWVVAYQNTNGPCWFTPTTQAANSQATTIGSATALNFDGSDDVVQISNSSVFNMSSGTIEAWFKTSNAGSGFRAIVVKEQYYCLFLLDNKICVFDWSGGGGFLSGGTYNDNNWHHVAFVFNYGVANGSKVFIDGVAQAAFTYNQGTA